MWMHGIQQVYRNSSIEWGGGGLIISNTFEMGLIGTGGLFNLAKTMVSVVHKEEEYKVKKLKCKKLEVMQPRIKNKSGLPVGE